MNSLEKKMALCLAMTLIIIGMVAYFWATEPARHAAATARIQVEGIQRGGYVFAASCAGCHGKQGEGLVGPALKGKDVSLIVSQVRKGGGMMPSFTANQISDMELQDLAAFVNSLK